MTATAQEFSDADQVKRERQQSMDKLQQYGNAAVLNPYVLASVRGQFRGSKRTSRTSMILLTKEKRCSLRKCLRRLQCG